MDLKVYERTRYQNIYRHKKNRNYVIMLSNPKTSISKIDNKKIFDVQEAIKVRDNPKIKLLKTTEIAYKDNFDSLWNKYIDWCIYEDKQGYNTYNKKQKIYNSIIKENFDKKLSKITKNEIVKFIDNLDTTDKQKNEILKLLKAFFNWCCKENYLIINPISTLKKYKTVKSKMNYWIPNDIQKFFSFIDNYINTHVDKEKETAYRIKILVLIGFSLGDRIGETRALKFGSINKSNSSINIEHSIDYNPNTKDYLGTTKTYSSQREIDISNKFIEEIDKYRYYLENELDYTINDNTLIFSNYENGKPLSDIILRKQFYKYCELAEVPHIRLYDLRHTYVATMMSEGKELYLISEKLGHTNFQTTVNKYGHLSNEVRKEIAKSTDKYLS